MWWTRDVRAFCQATGEIYVKFASSTKINPPQPESPILCARVGKTVASFDKTEGGQREAGSKKLYLPSSLNCWGGKRRGFNASLLGWFDWQFG
jgi:hypothetical protein